MPKEVKKYLTTSNKPIVYSGDEIQERDPVLRVLVFVLFA